MIKLDIEDQRTLLFLVVICLSFVLLTKHADSRRLSKVCQYAEELSENLAWRNQEMKDINLEDTLNKVNIYFDLVEKSKSYLAKQTPIWKNYEMTFGDVGDAAFAFLTIDENSREIADICHYEYKPVNEMLREATLLYRVLLSLR